MSKHTATETIYQKGDLQPADFASEPDPDEKARGRGRPSKLPDPGNKTLTPERWFAYVAALTPDDWAHAMVYAYSLRPRLKRNPKNIHSISEPIDETFLLRHNGSGKFKLMLNDTDTQRTMCTCYPELDDPLYPPKFDLHELDIAHPDNRAIVEELKREGKLDDQGNILAQPKGEETDTGRLVDGILQLAKMQQGNPQQSLDAAVFPKLIGLFEQASKKSIEMAFGQVKEKTGPSEFERIITTLQGLGVISQKPAAGAADPMMQMLMEDRRELRQELRDLRAELAKANAPAAATPAAKPKSLREQLQELVDVKEVTQTLFGGVGLASEKEEDWRKMGIRILGENIGGLVDLGKIALSRAVAGDPPTVTTTNPGPPAAAPRPTPVGSAAATPPPGAPAADTPPGAQVSTAENDPLYELRLQLLTYKEFLFRQFDSGKTGDEVALTIESVAGLANYQRIANCGKDALLTAFTTTQGLAEHFHGLEPQLSTWIDDFIGFGKPDEDPPADPPPADPPPAGPKPRKRKGETTPQ